MAIKRNRTEIACIMCKNRIAFPRYVGQGYSGDLLCRTCRSLLHSKLSNWEVKEYRVLSDESKGWKSSEKLKYWGRMSIVDTRPFMLPPARHRISVYKPQVIRIPV